MKMQVWCMCHCSCGNCMQKDYGWLSHLMCCPSADTDGCIVWNATIQYSAPSCLLPVLDDAIVSRACDWVMSCYYFRFSVLSCFFPCPSVKQHSSVRGLPNIGVGHRTLPKIWWLPFLYGAYSEGEWFWIDSVFYDSSVKMETRQPIEWSFVN